MSETKIDAEQILEIHPDSRYVLMLPERLDEDALIRASEIVGDWWNGRDGQTPILVLPGDVRLKLVESS